MAVCKTMKTKKGITSFCINSEHGDEFVTAFKYEDNQVEVHALNKDCAPLYLDEGTSVNNIQVEPFGVMLLVVTPNFTQNSLDVAIWDINSYVGFTPKDIRLQDEVKKETKFKCSIEVKQYINTELKSHVSTAYNGLFCVVVNDNFVIIGRLQKSPTTSINIDIIKTIQLSESFTVADLLFLSNNDEVSLVIAGLNDMMIYKIIEGRVAEDPYNLQVVFKKLLRANTITSLRKFNTIQCLVIDNMGHLYLFSLTSNNIVSLKFPISIYGHGICAIVNNKSDGLLAVCNENHTINLYSLKDITNSVVIGTATYVKPHRVLCSQYPINSMTFVKANQLAMASSANKLITFWGGLACNNALL